MKYNRLLTIIIIYAVIDMLYMMFCPPFHFNQRSFSYAFWRCIFYIDHYGIVAINNYFLLNYKKLKITIYDKTAICSLIIYSIFKLIFYIFLINKDLITYVYFLNSKPIDIVFSMAVWLLSALGSYGVFKNKEKII